MGIFDGKKVKALQRENNYLEHILSQMANNAVNRHTAVYPTMDTASYVTRYATTADVYSIISRLAGTAARIPIYPYLVKPDEDSKKAYKALSKIHNTHLKQYDVRNYTTKALEDLPDNDKVSVLLEQPCENKSKYEFYEAIYSFLFLLGNSLILKERPDIGPNRGLTIRMHVLHPQNIELLVSDSLPRKIVGYNYRVNGTLVLENISPDDIIHIKYFNPEVGINGSELWGQSPLKALTKHLTRLDANMDISVAQMQNGGVRTIVVDKSLISDRNRASEINDQRTAKMLKFFTARSNAGLPYNATGDLQAINLGSTLADMGVAEIAKIDFKKLCNAFGISDRLFNNDATGSEVSDTSAHKGLYTNAVLPNVYRVRDALKLELLTEFELGRKIETIDELGNVSVERIPGDGKKRDLREDLSEIPELQENFKDLAATFASLPIIIPNEILRSFGWETNEDPNMEKVYIKNGYSSIEDIQSIPDLPIDDNQ